MWVIEIEIGGGEQRAEREREFENLQVFYINYPVVKKQKKKIDSSVWMLTF